jgi:2-dehydropantoate 2-reductase
MKPTSNILVVGAGAIGGIIAAMLKKAGHNVTVLVRQASLAEKIRVEGIHVRGVLGEYTVPVDAFPSPSDLKAEYDYILLTTKANDVVDALRSLQSQVKEGTRVVSLQNGICEDALAGVLGRDKVIGCVVGWGATLHGDADPEITSGGEFVIGTLDGKVDEPVEVLQQVLTSILPAEVSQNIYGNKYSKLIINSCITTLGALTGMLLGEMLKKKIARRLFISIITEAMAVARSMNLKVEVYAGKINWGKFVAWKGWIGSIRRHILIRIIGLKYRKLKSSSLQSLERGLPTEIDYLNGYIVAKGKEHGIPTPVNEKIVGMIKEIEAGKRRINPLNMLVVY